MDEAHALAQLRGRGEGRRVRGEHAALIERLERGEQRGKHAPLVQLVPARGALLLEHAEAMPRAVDHAQREPRVRHVALRVRAALGLRSGRARRDGEAEHVTAALGARVRDEADGDEVLERDGEHVLAEGGGEAQLRLERQQLQAAAQPVRVGAGELPGGLVRAGRRQRAGHAGRAAAERRAARGVVRRVSGRGAAGRPVTQVRERQGPQAAPERAPGQG